MDKEKDEHIRNLIENIYNSDSKEILVSIYNDNIYVKSLAVNLTIRINDLEKQIGLAYFTIRILAVMSALGFGLFCFIK